MQRHNLERKVRYPDHANARLVLQQLGAVHEGVQTQTDTYFPVPAGRLKLRVIDDKRAVLIGYDRPNVAGDRTSAYYLNPVSDGALMEVTLRAALGVRGVVRKRRDVYHFHNVRVHLDEVEGLGTFLELEAVLSGDADEEMSRDRLQTLVGALGLDRTEALPGSYADLLGL